MWICGLVAGKEEIILILGAPFDALVKNGRIFENGTGTQ